MDWLVNVILTILLGINVEGVEPLDMKFLGTQPVLYPGHRGQVKVDPELPHLPDTVGIPKTAVPFHGGDHGSRFLGDRDRLGLLRLWLSDHVVM